MSKKWTLCIVGIATIGILLWLPLYRIIWKAGYHKAWTDYEEGFAHGRQSQHDYKRENQTSEYQWGDFDLDPLIEILCERAEIDSNDGFAIDCPDCNAVHIIHSPSGATWIGYFYIDATWTLDGIAADPNDEDYGKTIHTGSGVYCRFCRYPIGTDWRIIKLNN